MKEILAVSWEMPPLSGPRAVQVTRSLRELAALGWRSRVICFGPRSTRYQQDHDVSVDVDTGGAVALIKVPSPEEWLFFRALWRVCPPAKLLPDEKRLWVRPALAAARLALAHAPADLIVSFAQPWSGHLVGLALHIETGLPWVAHFSDPWIDSPYLRGAEWQRRYWQRLERDVISRATRVVFVNRQTADRVMAKYPAAWTARARVVPQGYDPPPAVPRSSRNSRGPLRLVYTGRFYDAVRTPQAMLQALAALNEGGRLEGRLHVEFIGSTMASYERLAARLNLLNIVAFPGRRSPAQAAVMAASADVLVVIDAPSEGPSLFLPSKLIDYLPLRKPILGLTPAEGPTADLLRRLGYPVVAPDDQDAIAAAIDQLLAASAAGTLAPSDQHDAVARAYDIRETSRVFADVLEEALAAA
jgi:glycosyltransferase involved in cell wall biosynthesis